MRLLTAGREVTQTAQTRSTMDQGNWPAKWTAVESGLEKCRGRVERILQVGSLGGL